MLSFEMVRAQVRRELSAALPWLYPALVEDYGSEALHHDRGYVTTHDAPTVYPDLTRHFIRKLFREKAARAV